MLNYIWAVMLLVGIVYGAFTGNMQAIGDEMLASSKEAVNLCITMFGVLGFWCGMMEAARKEGLVEMLTRKVMPFLHFLFPKIPRDSSAWEPISLNVIANVLGLGWAATPAGLQAMEELAKLKQKEGRYPADSASNEMCTFLILNISSLQLIPANIIAYRSQYGSENPAAIVVFGLLATAASTIVAVVFCKWKDRKHM